MVYEYVIVIRHIYNICCGKTYATSVGTLSGIRRMPGPDPGPRLSTQQLAADKHVRGQGSVLPWGTFGPSPVQTLVAVSPEGERWVGSGLLDNRLKTWSHVTSGDILGVLEDASSASFDV
jgi:hypothetical protein